MKCHRLAEMEKGERLSRAADNSENDRFRMWEGAVASCREFQQNGKNGGVVKAPATAAASRGATKMSAATPAAGAPSLRVLILDMLRELVEAKNAFASFSPANNTIGNMFFVVLITRSIAR